jgi:phosphoglycolate phosphatase
MTPLILFDLDGTLIDSLDDLAVSVNAALAENQLPERSKDEVRRAIGHGALRLIQNCVPTETPSSLMEQTYESFLKHYRIQCTLGTKPYPGVEETLQELAGRGFTLSLITNKPIGPTLEILKSLGWMKRFQGIVGGDTLPHRKPDPAGMWWLMGKAHSDPAHTLMVGDSSPDFAAAAAAGIRSIGFASNLAFPETWSPQPESIMTQFPSLLELV